MRHFLLTILALLVSSSAWAQVYADPNSNSDSNSSPPAAVGAPNSPDHYYLNNGSSSTVQVGRPYYYYPYYNGYPGPYPGYGSGSDSNDPNYFPGVAAPGPNTGATKNSSVHHSKKKALPKVDTTTEY